DHLPENDGVHVGAVQIDALEQLARHKPRQIHGPRVLQRCPRLAEWRAIARDDRDAPPITDRHYIPLPSGSHETYHGAGRRAKPENADERSTVFTSHARRRTR